jgi:hypothetical protein
VNPSCRKPLCSAGKLSPETALSRVTPEEIALSFATNATGPVLVCQAFENLLAAAANHGATAEAPAVIANVSARVGSIGDNGLGGWYSYRYYIEFVANCSNKLPFMIAHMHSQACRITLRHLRHLHPLRDPHSAQPERWLHR